jgi:hypothetical protein
MARVLAVSCTHAPCMLPKFPAFLSKVWDKYQCNRFVHLGDLVDNAAISYHEKHSALSSAPEEYKKAKKQVQEITKRFPKADFLIGNHDALGERQAVTIGLLPEWLRDFNDIWGLPKAWKVHTRYTELEVDGTIYIHGDSGKGGQFGAVKTAMSKFQNLVGGHLHGEAGCWYYANGNARIFGMNVGCGVDHKALAQEYGRKFVKKPIIGCGVVLDGFPIFIPMDI